MLMMRARSMVSQSLPGLPRQSIFFARSLFAKRMDAQVKPGHDEGM
jgi:hypothetical protein